MARAIAGGGRYWTRRRWWPRYMRANKAVAIAARDAVRGSGYDVGRICVRVSPSGGWRVEVETLGVLEAVTVAVVVG